MGAPPSRSASVREGGQRMRRGGGWYVIRTRKPYAILGLPIIGRHFGYVGETNNHARRKGEHLHGSTRYREVVLPKPWADLDPKVYQFSLPDWRWLRLSIEAFMIGLLCPVYNVKGQQPWNIRRITPRRALRQRAARDRGGVAIRVTGSLARAAVWMTLIGFVWWHLAR